MMAKYTIVLDEQFDNEITELVQGFNDLGIEITVPELIVKLAKGLGLNEIRNYELAKKG